LKKTQRHKIVIAIVLGIILLTTISVLIVQFVQTYLRFSQPISKNITKQESFERYECPPSTILVESPDPIYYKSDLRRLKYETVISDYIKQVNPRLEDWYISTLTDAIIHQSLVMKYDPLLTAAIIKHESTYKNTCIGAAGERGLMQIHPCHRQFNRSRLFEISYNIYAGLTVSPEIGRFIIRWAKRLYWWSIRQIQPDLVCTKT